MNAAAVREELVLRWEPINRLRVKAGLPEHPGGDCGGDILRLLAEQRWALESAEQAILGWETEED